MKRWILAGMALLTLGCGYKVVSWTSPGFKTVEVAPVNASGIGESQELSFRLREALMTRFLSNSGLRPVTENADLVLKTTLSQVNQTTLATGTDGRTERLQLALNASFELENSQGERLWQLENYRYTDQIEVSTTSQGYTDETVSVQEAAMKAVADLVVNNVSLVIAELGDGE